MMAAVDDYLSTLLERPNVDFACYTAVETACKVLNMDYHQSEVSDTLKDVETLTDVLTKIDLNNRPTDDESMLYDVLHEMIYGV